MRVLITTFLFLIPCQMTYGACPTNIVGTSKNLRVSIYRDCGMKDEIAIEAKVVEKRKKKTEVSFNPLQSVLLETECQFTSEEKMLKCHAHGKTVLAGMQFKLIGESYYCDGDPDFDKRFRYVCVKGCDKQVPRSLTVEAYECGG